METLEGVVTKVKYSTPDGYAVLDLAVDGRVAPVVATGQLAQVAVGEHLRVDGHWVEHPKFGKQLKVKDYRAKMPTSDEGLMRYLSSGVVKGIGPAIAERLVGAFGAKLFELTERDPLVLMQVDGIGKKRAKALAKAFEAQRGQRETMVFLQGLGLGPKMASRVQREWGEETREHLEADPYRLAREIDGFGFLSADDLARHLGIQQDSPSRLRAGLLHRVMEGSDAGHTVVSREELLDGAEHFLGAARSPLESALVDAVRAGELLERQDAGGETVIGQPALVRGEEAIAREIVRLSARAPRKDDQPMVSPEGITLTEEQAAAVRLASAAPVSVITGGPGTGKTTVLRTLVGLFLGTGDDPALCAPTGRAAKRLAEATGSSAGTVHRLLGFRGGRFQHGRHDAIGSRVVIVDEASMLDIRLARALVEALPAGGQIVFVGDADQLPSVGPGNVLHDLIASGKVKVARLNTLFRQKDTSQIVLNAHRIREGQLPEASPSGARSGDFHLVNIADPERARDRLVEICCDRIPQAFGLDPVDDVQVLSPMHRGAVGTVALNRALQDRLNPPRHGTMISVGDREFRVGDKVMQIRNDYERDVFNGDLGRIVDLDVDARRVVVAINGVRLDYGREQLGQLTLAYCISIHKSQGSEYPAVVMPLLTQHYVLLQRNLLYTAVTRAKDLVVIVGTKEAMKLAVRREGGTGRVTRLGLLLRDAL